MFNATWQFLLQENNVLEHQGLLGFILFHLSVSGLLALLMSFALPHRYQSCHRGIRFLFLWMLGIFLSELGLLLAFLMAHLAEYLPNKPEQDLGFLEIDLPEYSIYPWVTVNSSGLSGAKERINKQELPAEVRIKSLMALQQSATSGATNIITELLADTNDDIRLLAFGLLDKREKHINNQIAQLRKQLDAIPGKVLSLTDYHQKSNVLQRLGELYWALVYENLVQGDLKLFSLARAEDYTRQAMTLDKENNPLALFQLAKILNAAERFEEAFAAFNKAVSFGLSEDRALPYLAELDYNLRQYNKVHEIFAQLGERTVVLPKIRKLASVWHTQATQE
ncbi:MAG: hypothetical protein K0U21_02510 [Proteobacteria bacterium]|nr:hypothetical protein [Pseudomonadota bacterium]